LCWLPPAGSVAASDVRHALEIRRSGKRSALGRIKRAFHIFAASSPSHRHNSKLPPPINSISFEIREIHRENRRQRFSSRNVYERCVGEIHGVVPVARHQCVDVGEFRILDCHHRHRPGPEELPRGLRLPAIAAHHVKQLGQNGFRCCQRQAELLECIHAGLVPAICSVQQCENCACIA
jgi:hypothetical protein